MNLRAKSFVLNRRKNWQSSGIIDNLCFEDENLVSNMDNGKNGYFFSSGFDSLEKDTKWHRMQIESKITENSLMKVIVYASNQKVVNVLNEKTGKEMSINLDDYLGDKSVPSYKKLDVLNYVGAKTFNNPYDLLMFEFKGRYIWINFELTSYDSPIKISKLKIEFPMISFIDFLPAVYRSSDKSTFMSRYIGIFQSLYVDLEKEISDLPVKFSVNTESIEFLEWLSSWFSVGDIFIWGEERLREVLKNSIELYKIKGTKESIRRITELYIGTKPIIIEHFDVTEHDCFINDKEHMEKLYGKNQYTFTVILRSKDMPNTQNYVELLRLINRFKPIDTICNLVVLSDNIYLDHHCYLGVNSRIATQKSIILSPDECMSNSIFISQPELES